MLQILARMFEAKTHIGVGGEVKNKTASRHRACQGGQIETIAFNQFEPRIDCRRLKEFALAGGKIIPTDDAFAIGEKPVNEIAADKSSRTGDKNLFHDRVRSLVPM